MDDISVRPEMAFQASSHLMNWKGHQYLKLEPYQPEPSLRYGKLTEAKLDEFFNFLENGLRGIEAEYVGFFQFEWNYNPNYRYAEEVLRYERKLDIRFDRDPSQSKPRITLEFYVGPTQPDVAFLSNKWKCISNRNHSVNGVYVYEYETTLSISDRNYLKLLLTDFFAGCSPETPAVVDRLARLIERHAGSGNYLKAVNDLHEIQQGGLTAERKRILQNNLLKYMSEELTRVKAYVQTWNETELKNKQLDTRYDFPVIFLCDDYFSGNAADLIMLETLSGHLDTIMHWEMDGDIMMPGNMDKLFFKMYSEVLYQKMTLSGEANHDLEDKFAFFQALTIQGLQNPRSLIANPLFISTWGDLMGLSGLIEDLDMLRSDLPFEETRSLDENAEEGKGSDSLNLIFHMLKMSFEMSRKARAELANRESELAFLKEALTPEPALRFSQSETQETLKPKEPEAVQKGIKLM